MDIKLEKKPWYIRYRYYLAGGVAFLAFLIYVVTLSLGPSKLRIEQDNIQIAEVKNGKFMEYVDVEGVIQPILTIKVNAREAGSVERIIGEEGSLLRQGDTILVMENPDLLRSIEDQRDDWEKQLITYREKEIEMEQKSLNLQQQALQTDYDLNRLRKSFALDKEEYRMGIKSKAQLEVSEDEYNYKVKNAHLQRESLRHDSAVTVIRKDLIRNDRERERKKYFVNTKQRRVPVSLDAPTFTLSHTAGFKGVLGGEYNFNLTEASIRKRFWLGSWGKLDVTARAGAQWNTVPFPLLNLPMANLSYITQNNESFNLINNMEFLNDRYASLNLSYDMNGKLFNRIPLIKKLKWREMFRIRGLWGTLTDKNNPYKSNNPDLFLFPMRDGVPTSHVMGKTPYVEASVGIYNIFKLLHIEYVRRLTYTDIPGVKKGGIRFMILMIF